MTPDGKYLVVASTQTGGAGGADAWDSTVNMTAWGPLGRTHLMMVDDLNDQYDPMISSTGLHLYLAPSTAGTSRTQQLALATRMTSTDNFGAPNAITELNDPTSLTADPMVNADETVIVFTSGRNGTLGGGDLWYATRTSAGGAWSTPVKVPGVNTAANEGDPHLSGDGCRLYFASDRDAGMDWDLFVATAQ